MNNNMMFSDQYSVQKRFGLHVCVRKGEIGRFRPSAKGGGVVTTCSAGLALWVPTGLASSF